MKRLTEYDRMVIRLAAAHSSRTAYFLPVVPLGEAKPGTLPAQWDILLALAHEAQDRLSLVPRGGLADALRDRHAGFCAPDGGL